MRPQRLPIASGIDPQVILNFKFDGRPYQGVAGDTLASALLANGVCVVGRSFKRHRPRGLIAAGLEECNALVTVGSGGMRRVSMRATEVQLREGLIARSQNAWPGVRWDLGAINDLLAALLPAGFYHKTFKWPQWRWYEWAVRRAAGLARVGSATDPETYARRYAHADVLVVGAGPAGIAAALAAAARGVDVILLDNEPAVGGSLSWSSETVAAETASTHLSQALAAIDKAGNVQLMRSTLALGYYDDNLIAAVEQCGREPDSQRLWKIRAAQVILATGAYERPLVFPGNDRPGVRLLDGAARHALQYGVSPGGSSIVYTNHDAAWQRAIALRRGGVAVAAIVDVRHQVRAELQAQARAQDIAIYPGYAIVATRGRRQLRGIELAALDRQGNFADRSVTRLPAAQLLMSGGWNPVVHLYSQAGGALRFDSRQLCFVPDGCRQNVVVVGAANGAFSLAECITQGEAAGAGCARPAPLAGGLGEIEAWWQTPAHNNHARANQQWVDFLYDVTVADIALAARENFQSVEHLKRYTATGMAVDQGKTSNINALAIMAQMIGREITAVGTTRFRPPFHPVTIGALAGERVDELAQRYRRLPVSWHRGNGAVFEDHSGWLRPAYYLRDDECEAQAIAAEVTAARNAVTLFDSSSLGKIDVQGGDAAEFLNRLYINNVKSLRPGRLRYGMMLNENGIIIDDGVLACLAQDHYLVMTSSAGALVIPFWMEEWLQTEWAELDVFITPQTAQWATLALSGPQARAVLAKLQLDIDLEHFDHLCLRETALCGVPLRICRVSFTGERCYEINVPARYADALWRHLLVLGEPFGIRALGMEALNVLRIEKGFLEVGVDTDGETTALDVGWGVPISNKADDFLGRRSLSRSHMQGATRPQLVGFTSPDPRLAIAVGTHLVDAAGLVQGHVTSAALSPTLARSIGMARVIAGANRYGETLLADIAGKRYPVTLADTAQYDPTGSRLHV